MDRIFFGGDDQDFEDDEALRREYLAREEKRLRDFEDLLDSLGSDDDDSD